MKIKGFPIELIIYLGILSFGFRAVDVRCSPFEVNRSRFIHRVPGDATPESLIRHNVVNCRYEAPRHATD